MAQPILKVENLCKKYPEFYLDNISFSLTSGTITGFVGKNGAGKTTTLHCLLDLAHPTSGEIYFFGSQYKEDPREIRQHVGFASGSTDYYIHKKLKTLSQVTGRFYKEWDESLHTELLNRFSLNPEKTPDELSSGMKVKYSIATALSYHAPLLILDEPTSGLDPASRSDLLELFLDLVENHGVTILFSTQITTDLEDYADNIIYIKNGKLLADTTLEDFKSRYRLLRFAEKPADTNKLIGLRRIRGGWDALILSGNAPQGAEVLPATLSEIMVHID